MFIPYEYFWQYCYKNEKAISLVCIHNFVSFMKSWNLIIFCQITQAFAQSPFNFFDMVFISIRLKRKMKRRLFHAFHWQFLIINSTDNFLSPITVSHWFIFCCGNLIIKTQLFGETKQKNAKQVYVNISILFSELAPTDPWCNMLQTL